MIGFLQTFTGKDDDKTLRKQLLSQESLSGILNIALTHLKEWIDADGNFKDDEIGRAHV